MIQLSAAGKRSATNFYLKSRLADHAQGPRWTCGRQWHRQSTLMKVLAGMESLDYGTLSTTKGVSAGYLPKMD